MKVLRAACLALPLLFAACATAPAEAPELAAEAAPAAPPLAEAAAEPAAAETAVAGAETASAETVATPVEASPAAPAPAKRSDLRNGDMAPDGTRVSCRAVPVIGTRFPKRTCKSEAAWKEFDEITKANAKEASDNFQRNRCSGEPGRC